MQRIKITPYPYQLKGVRRAVDKFKGCALIADEMGLGKTLESLLVLKEFGENALPCIVICPAHLKINWAREIRSILGWRSLILNGMSAGPIVTDRKIIIVNYTILGKWLPFLKKLKPKFLIIDEIHNCKNRSAKRTRWTKSLARKIKHRLGLSGTPIENGYPAELWSQISIIRPSLFPSFFAYATEYCAPERTRWGWVFKGAENLPELHRILKENVMIRRLKKNVLKELPKKTRMIVPLEIENRAEYDQAINDFVTWLKRRIKKRGKLTRALRAQALVKIGYIKRLVARLKMKAVLAWLDDFLAESTGKLIVFCIHKKIVARLADKYHNLSVVLDGSKSSIQKQTNIDRFQKKKSVRMMIANIQSGGTGWNGTAASTTATIEFGWKPGEHTQAEARVDRIGQKLPVFCYCLIAKDTIEESNCQKLQKKQTINEETLDGKAVGEFNVFDDFLTEIGGLK